jgi:hypothetical protein
MPFGACETGVSRTTSAGLRVIAGAAWDIYGFILHAGRRLEFATFGTLLPAARQKRKDSFGKIFPEMTLSLLRQTLLRTRFRAVLELLHKWQTSYSWLKIKGFSTALILRLQSTIRFGHVSAASISSEILTKERNFHPCGSPRISHRPLAVRPSRSGPPHLRPAHPL